MTLAIAHERRLHPRQAHTKPCKLRDPMRLSFASGVTHDVSAGGLCVEVQRERPYAVGDRVDVAVQWATGAVIASSSMARGVVRRVQDTAPGKQIVAIELAPASSAAAA